MEDSSQIHQPPLVLEEESRANGSWRAMTTQQYRSAEPPPKAPPPNSTPKARPIHPKDILERLRKGQQSKSTPTKATPLTDQMMESDRYDVDPEDVKYGIPLRKKPPTRLPSSKVSEKGAYLGLQKRYPLEETDFICDWCFKLDTTTFWVYKNVNKIDGRDKKLCQDCLSDFSNIGRIKKLFHMVYDHWGFNWEEIAPNLVLTDYTSRSVPRLDSQSESDPELGF